LLLLVASWFAAPLAAAAAEDQDDPNAAPAAPPTPVASPAPASGFPEATGVTDAGMPSPVGDAEWSRRYVQARAQMLAGRFAEAAAQFAALVTSSREVSQQILAREQADICGRWARGGLVLVRGAELSMGRARAAATLGDRRSTDELGILYTAAVVYGLGTGITLDFWTEPDSAAAGILPALALAGGSVALIYLLDNPENLHYGVAQAITSGLWVGLEEGLAWTLWNQARALSTNEWSARTVATVLWATSTAGAVVGGALGTAYGTTPGRASLTGSAALWSALVVGLLSAAVVTDSPTADDTYLLISALALNGGAVTGAIIGKDVSPSIARVRFIDLGALSGGIVAGGIYLAASNGHPGTRGLSAVLAAGIAGGVLAAWRLTAGMEPDYPRPGGLSPAAAATVAPSLLPSASHGRGVDGMVVGLAGEF
jgi:hypothetical protein